jgi:autotransporter family porin
MINMKTLALTGVALLAGSVILTAVLLQGRSHQAASVRSPIPSAASTMLTPSAAATATPIPSPMTPTPIATVAAAPARSTQLVSYFTTLAPGSALPGDAECARAIASNPWEPRPANRTANQTNVYAQGFRFQSSYFQTYGPAYQSRVTGNFTGTTDQILRWGACKWGFDENTVRAQAVVESWWRQSTLGDCNATTQPETHGCASVGILQVKGANIPPTHPGTWPAAWTSTAFNVDYTLAIRRLCYEGKETWLHDKNSSYAAGDLWGCIGRWYSGGWHDPGANQYIQKVQSTLAAKTWRTF